MTHSRYDFDIFRPDQSESFCKQDDFFLDIDYFYQEEVSTEPKDQPPQLERTLTDQFAEEPHFEPFTPYPLPLSPQAGLQDESNLFRQEQEPFREEEGAFFREEISTPSPIVSSQQNKKIQAKSIATKNVCFNICQKTIKVIQKKIYAKKLEEICEYFGTDEENFEEHIVNQKKHFTGPKALSMYVESETVNAKVFREFMKWFLKEKYLRHCLNGDMKDKESYIKYKNEVILVLLE